MGVKKLFSEDMKWKKLKKIYIPTKFDLNFLILQHQKIIRSIRLLVDINQSEMSVHVSVFERNPLIRIKLSCI